MCTVTYIPHGDNLYITSNRDEKNRRTAAFPPTVYEFTSGNLLFPKDGDFGGSWIAAHENGNMAVFLNGGITAHKSAPPYRKSRGLILLDLIDHHTPFNCFLAVNLNNIEPFTAVLRDNGHLFECIWDGNKKHYEEFDGSRPRIWSSVTLYNEAVISKREKWFETWLTEHPSPSTADILHFHQFTGDGDIHNDLLMNRNGEMITVSITSLQISRLTVKMDYLDLLEDTRYTEQLICESSMADK